MSPALMQRQKVFMPLTSHPKLNLVTRRSIIPSSPNDCHGSHAPAFLTAGHSENPHLSCFTEKSRTLCTARCPGLFLRQLYTFRPRMLIYNVSSTNTGHRFIYPFHRSVCHLKLLDADTIKPSTTFIGTIERTFLIKINHTPIIIHLPLFFCFLYLINIHFLLM